jgi:hypothetical protein
MTQYPKKKIDHTISRLKANAKTKFMSKRPNNAEGKEGDIVFSHKVGGVKLHVKRRGQWWDFTSDNYGNKNEFSKPASYFFASRKTDTTAGSTGDAGDWGIPFTHVQGRGANKFNVTTKNVLIGNKVSDPTGVPERECAYAATEPGLYYFNLNVVLKRVENLGLVNTSIFAHSPRGDMGTKAVVSYTMVNHYDATEQSSSETNFITRNVSGVLALSAGDRVRTGLRFSSGAAQNLFQIAGETSTYKFETFFEGFKLEGCN